MNYQWWWAAHGICGINFHTGDKVAARDETNRAVTPCSGTAPGGYNVHPIGYAEKMFSLGSRGRMLTVNISPAAANLNFAAYAVLGGDKFFYVTLINRSHGATATNLSVQIDARDVNGWRRGEVIRLTAPGGEVQAKPA